MDGATSYDDDVYAWSREQAAMLRGLASRAPGLPNALDLENVAEEIEDVGKSELHRVESFLELLMLHLIKLASAPEASPAPHWGREIEVEHESLLADFRNSMRRSIDLDRIWRRSAARADAALDEHGDAILPDLPKTCPFSLDELVSREFDVADAVARLQSVTSAAETKRSSTT